MNADRVIKSNAEFFNTGTWVGGTWRRNTILACEDNVQAAIRQQFSGVVFGGHRELPQNH